MNVVKILVPLNRKLRYLILLVFLTDFRMRSKIQIFSRLSFHFLSRTQEIILLLNTFSRMTFDSTIENVPVLGQSTLCSKFHISFTKKHFIF